MERYSLIQEVTFDARKQQLKMQSNLEMNTLEDDTDYIQFGWTNDREFYYFNWGVSEEFETDTHEYF